MLPVSDILTPLLRIDALAQVMLGLIAYIGLVIVGFAWRYMQGDARFGAMMRQWAALVAALALLVCSDHIAVFCLAWGVSNALLVRLMIHKPGWPAARRAGGLAARYLGLGWAGLLGAAAMLYSTTGSTSIARISSTPLTGAEAGIAAALIVMAAMAQSAIWPFHRWLLSSLNAPTPVSALMHAGLVNGGGFLLARFSALLLAQPLALDALFAFGIATALLGTLWMLMQHDIKRMLACSTMAQMGFMIAQCGLGLFAAAVVHMVWHGLFKAYLFLASGSAAQEKPLDLAYPPALHAFAAALLCGLGASYSFALASGKLMGAADTTWLLLLVAGVAGAQFALPILRPAVGPRLPLALLASGAMGGLYGGSVALLAEFLAPLALMQPQPLHAGHLVGAVLLVVSWASVLFVRYPRGAARAPGWMQRGYVAALNASQPHPDTLTAHRHHYSYR